MNNVFNVIDDPTAAGGYKTQQYANILQGLFAQQKAKEEADKAAAVGDWQARTAGKGIYEAGQSAPVSSMDPRQAALYQNASPSPEDLNRAAVTKEQGRLINSPDPQSLDDYVGHERAVNKVNPDSAQIMMKAMSIYNQMPEGPAKEAFGIKYGLETNATTDAKLKSAEGLAKDKAKIEADRFAATEKDKEASREIARLALASGDKRAQQAIDAANARAHDAIVAGHEGRGYSREQAEALAAHPDLASSGLPGTHPPGSDDRVQAKVDEVLNDPTGASYHSLPDKLMPDKMLKSQVADAIAHAGYSLPGKPQAADRTVLQATNSVALGLASMETILDKWEKRGKPLTGKYAITSSIDSGLAHKGGRGVGMFTDLTGKELAEYREDITSLNELSRMIALQEVRAKAGGRPNVVMYQDAKDTLPSLSMTTDAIRAAIRTTRQQTDQTKQAQLGAIWGSKIPAAALNYAEVSPDMDAHTKKLIMARGSGFVNDLQKAAASHFDTKYTTNQEQAISYVMQRDGVTRQVAIKTLEAMNAPH